jgi:hypothetical protein
MPVAAFNVYVPSLATVTIPSASHDAGDDPGIIKHVAAVLNGACAVARPDALVNVVKVVVPPGMTVLDSGLAVGAVGVPTVTCISALVRCVAESSTTYLIGDAVPVNEGSGLNVTVPSGLTVYVPSPLTVNDVNVHEESAVVVVGQSRSELGTIVPRLPAMSLVRGVMV